MDDRNALESYYARFRRVFKHIDENLQNELNLDEVNHVAAFSKFHQLRRLKRASFELAFRDRQPVLHIA